MLHGTLNSLFKKANEVWKTRYKAKNEMFIPRQMGNKADKAYTSIYDIIRVVEE